MIVREVRPSDRDEWLRMRNALWPHHDPNKHATETDEHLASGSLLTVFVAERSEGGLAGFLEAALRPYADGCGTHPVGYIEGWYVDPDVRRRGVGRALVEAFEAWSRNRGCSEMASDCHVENDASRSAHAALCFDEVEVNVHFRKAVT